MIMHPKTDPEGLDYFVYQMQRTAQQMLPGIFGVNESLCLFYGRGETITEGDAQKAVLFTSGKDYIPLGYDDKYAFMFYLMMDDNFKTQNLSDKANVSLFCHGNLGMLFPNKAHRADTELQKVLNEFVHHLIEPQDYKYIEIIEAMHPIHSFKINFTVQ
jgi:hypothetical protein